MPNFHQRSHLRPCYLNFLNGLGVVVRTLLFQGRFITCLSAIISSKYSTAVRLTNTPSYITQFTVIMIRRAGLWGDTSDITAITIRHAGLWGDTSNITVIMMPHVGL